MTDPTGRRVTASMSLTLDGRYNGPGGPDDLGRIVPYMTTEVARDQLTRIWEGATTALLGRRNAEGFLGWWSPLAERRSPGAGNDCSTTACRLRSGRSPIKRPASWAGSP